jgi:hypothetical protein
VINKLSRDETLILSRKRLTTTKNLPPYLPQSAQQKAHPTFLLRLLLALTLPGSVSSSPFIGSIDSTLVAAGSQKMSDYQNTGE